VADVKTTTFGENLHMSDDTLPQHDFSYESPLTGLSAVTLNDIEEPLLLPDNEYIEDEIEEETEEEIPLGELEHYDDAIKIYLRDIQRTPLLNAASEKELALKIEK
jgi:hypothetical protein